MSVRARLNLALTAVLATSFAILVIAFLPAVLQALQADTTVVDRTGIFGPVINHYWPVIVTFLTSLTLKVVALFNQGVARLPEPAQWGILYFLALGYNAIARLLDWGLVDPDAPLFAVSMIEMGAAGLIYKFGGHTVPKLPAANSPRG